MGTGSEFRGACPRFCNRRYDFSASLRSLTLSRHPKQVTLVPGIKRTRKHEKQVGQPIQINYNLRVNAFRQGKRDHVALGAAADSPRQMAPGRRCMAARQDEALER